MVHVPLNSPQVFFEFGISDIDNMSEVLWPGHVRQWKWRGRDRPTSVGVRREVLWASGTSRECVLRTG